MKEEFSQEYTDRFSGIGRLYGIGALPKLQKAHVVVIGIGGVGSWAAEALARSGIGTITLIDLDEVCVTNVNRQLHALADTFGKTKVAATAERLRLINPELTVHEQIAFLTKKTASTLLLPGVDCTIDAIDNVEQKAFIVTDCLQKKIPLVTVGGAGGKQNPASIMTADLAFTTNDRLLRLVRKELRASYGFPKEQAREPIGVRSVYSSENARFPWADGTVRETPEPGAHLRLNCDTGFGTSTMLTGSFGFTAAAEAVAEILKDPGHPCPG